MNEYLQKWYRICENTNDETTYNVVFGKAILECLNYFGIGDNPNYGDRKAGLYIKDIVNNMIGIYLHQLYNLNLSQGSDTEISKIVKEIIVKYKRDYKGNLPENISYCKLEGHNMSKSKKEIFSRIVKTKIIPSFQEINGETLNLYEIKEDKLLFNIDDLWFLRYNYKNLTYLLDYRWLKLLKKFNKEIIFSEQLLESVSFREFLQNEDKTGGDLKDIKRSDSPVWDYESKKFIYEVDDYEMKSDKPINFHVDKSKVRNIEGEGWEADDEK